MVLLLVLVCCDTAQTLVFFLVLVCCNTAQALIFLLVSVFWDTAQALMPLLASVCWDTAQWCRWWRQCVGTQSNGAGAGVSVLGHSPSQGGLREASF